MGHLLFFSPFWVVRSLGVISDDGGVVESIMQRVLFNFQRADAL